MLQIMRWAGVAAALLVVWSASGAAGSRAPHVSHPNERGRAVRYLALGDSYTIGEGVVPAERWPEQLAASLRARGVTIEGPEIIARTGWTTGELGAAIAERSPHGPFALVSLLIGVNNQYRGRSVEEYRDQFSSLLRLAIALAGRDAKRVIVLSIPDWGVTPFAEGRDRAGIAAAIDTFNQIARDETHRAGARWVDVTPASRAAARDSRMIVADGLHPSGAMYAKWAALAGPEARAALGIQ
jgi:lysophospholipase L1-like esterase